MEDNLSLYAGTHVFIGQKGGGKQLYQTHKENIYGIDEYYYSKEVVEGRYESYLMNKKWSLSEEFSKHLLIYQQVGHSFGLMQTE